MGRAEVFSQRVKDVVDDYDRNGVSLRQLAKLSGVSYSAISSWQTGARTTPRDDAIDKFCAFTNMPKAWLWGFSESEIREAAAEYEIDIRSSDPSPSLEIDSRDFVLLPKVAEQVAAGSPVLDLSTVQEHQWYAFRAAWVRYLGAETDPNRLCVVQVAPDHKGESMIPVIQPGAMLVVDRGPGGRGIDAIDQGKVYLVRDPEDPDGVMVKRVFYNRGQLVYWSDNFSLHPPITVPLSGRQLREVIVGKVILVQQKLDGDE